MKGRAGDHELDRTLRKVRVFRSKVPSVDMKARRYRIASFVLTRFPIKRRGSSVSVTRRAVTSSELGRGKQLPVVLRPLYHQSADCLTATSQVFASTGEEAQKGRRLRMLTLV